MRWCVAGFPVLPRSQSRLPTRKEPPSWKSYTTNTILALAVGIASGWTGWWLWRRLGADHLVVDSHRRTLGDWLTIFRGDCLSLSVCVSPYDGAARPHKPTNIVGRYEALGGDDRRRISTAQKPGASACSRRDQRDAGTAMLGGGWEGELTLHCCCTAAPYTRGAWQKDCRTEGSLSS